MYIPIKPTMFDILDILFIAVLFDEQASFAQIVPWHTREEVMCDLEM
jgi:hypothetical protein